MQKLLDAKRYLEQSLRDAGLEKGKDFAGVSVTLRNPGQLAAEPADLIITLPSISRGARNTIATVLMHAVREEPKSKHSAGTLKTLPNGDLGPYVVEVWTRRAALPAGWRNGIGGSLSES